MIPSTLLLKVEKYIINTAESATVTSIVFYLMNVVEQILG